MGFPGRGAQFFLTFRPEVLGSYLFFGSHDPVFFWDVLQHHSRFQVSRRPAFPGTLFAGTLYLLLVSRRLVFGLGLSFFCTGKKVMVSGCPGFLPLPFFFICGPLLALCLPRRRFGQAIWPLVLDSSQSVSLWVRDGGNAFRLIFAVLEAVFLASHVDLDFGRFLRTLPPSTFPSSNLLLPARCLCGASGRPQRSAVVCMV